MNFSLPFQHWGLFAQGFSLPSGSAEVRKRVTCNVKFFLAHYVIVGTLIGLVSCYASTGILFMFHISAVVAFVMFYILTDLEVPGLHVRLDNYGRTGVSVAVALVVLAYNRALLSFGAMLCFLFWTVATHAILHEAPGRSSSK